MFTPHYTFLIIFLSEMNTLLSDTVQPCIKKVLILPKRLKYAQKHFFFAVTIGCSINQFLQRGFSPSKFSS